MVKWWMLGFVILAIVATISNVGFDIPAAGTVAIISLIVAFLLLISRIFERTASA